MANIQVITACTGLKSLPAKDGPGLALLEEWRGNPPASGWETKKAEQLYSGQQHVNLMQGVRAAREAGHRVDVNIVSAGFGLIPGTQHIPSYNVTFADMPASRIRSWADTLSIPGEVKLALATPYDLTIVALGVDYLKAARLEKITETASPTLVFTNKSTAGRLPSTYRPIQLTVDDTRRFGAGKVALKGKVAGTLLQRIADNTITINQVIAQDADVLGLLDPMATTRRKKKPSAAPAENHNIHNELKGLKVSVGSLVLDPDNARKHDEPNLEAIMHSLKEFGQRMPIVVQRDGMVVRAGNGRLVAAKRLGWTHIAALVADDTDEIAAAYAIADNRTGELASWDYAQLVDQFKELQGSGVDLTALGWEQPELDMLLKEASFKPDAVAEMPTTNNDDDVSGENVPTLNKDVTEALKKMWEKHASKGEGFGAFVLERVRLAVEEDD